MKVKLIKVTMKKMPGYVDPIGNIKGKPGTMNPRIKHVLDQIASVKVTGEFLEKRGADLGVHALNTLGGVKVASYDYEKYKAEMIMDYYEMMKNSAKTPEEKNVANLFTPPSKEQVKTYNQGAKVLASSLGKNADVRWTLVEPTKISDRFTKEDLERREKIRKELESKGKINKKVEKKVEEKVEEIERRFVETNVVNVIDGDTISVNIKSKDGDVSTVRMLLIDTPETVSPDKPVMPFGKEASEYANKMLSGKNVKLYYDTENIEYDKYGRILAYVHVGDVDFNKSQLEKGYAKLSFIDDKYSKVDEYKEVQKKHIMMIRGFGV